MNSLSDLFHLISREKFINNVAEFKHTVVYYGNVCNECFLSSPTLKKCSSCKVVSYCSRDHQVVDWTDHKLLCKVLRNVNVELILPTNCSFEDFTKYRENIASELTKVDSCFCSSEYIRQLSQFPWVCSVCYSKENLNFICKKCESVVYCSSEHMLQDNPNHEPNCYNLKLCRIFDSLIYENGFPLKLMKFVFEEVPRSVKIFPKSRKELSCLIQKQVTGDNKDDMQDMVNYCKHNDIYAAGSTILYALETIGSLHKRVFTKKPFLSKRDRQQRLHERMACQMLHELCNTEISPIKPAMVIHIVAADSGEINIQWTAFIGLLTHWMINIDYIEVILVGQALQNCQEPDFDNLKGRSGYQCHPEAYKNVVKKLIHPDLIVLYNYGYNEEKTIQFHEYETQRALFKHKNIPLLITSTNKNLLNNLVEKLLELPGVQVQVNTRVNEFAEARPYRVWSEKNISTYVKHQYLAVLTRH